MRGSGGGVSRIVVAASVAASFVSVPQLAWSQATYPVKPVRMVVPFAPGGPNDTIARILGQQLGESLGQQIVVDNRPGGGGSIGTDAVAKAAPDGYTLLSGGMGSLVLNPLLGKVPYDTVRDFAPIILMATAPSVLAVHPSLPVKSLSDLVSMARASPGKLNYASGGSGSTTHLQGALLGVMTGVNVVHVPYKGTAPSLTALLGGEVQFSFLGIPTALPHVRSGKLRVLAVSGKSRSSQLPDAPTVSEAGAPGYDVNPWYGVLAPAGTPRAIVARLNSDMAKIVRTPETRDKFAAQGAEPMTTTPEEYAATIRSDIALWTKMVKELGLRSD
jgi:tripartite-type tricarboxylate transporter receptor subunit TctC